MLRNSLKAGKPFKSPMSRPPGPPKDTSADPPAVEYQKLKAQEAQLDAEIKRYADNETFPEELQDYIELLHKYNEYKDMAQVFMGQLAQIDGFTAKEVAARLSAPTEK